MNYVKCSICGHEHHHECPKCHWECKLKCEKCPKCDHWFEDECECPKCHKKCKHDWCD
ncbi:hypothetical protein SPACI_022180 [Sporomusa acidovorans DSM 3132]|uniref:CTCHY-type domain-containing protein n=1 Tax=Sporomusa acidovorans (strain ATCC 49682 / DSM 3132 / Mol) TaxID=1123286 RepID=A0ABZ3J1C6_SPOA4|nr:hypothetical protein SPACI_01840 [Sporomusa acidovorans DSM 3132]SDF37299.1 hypothetical protein SAMN04488499_104613 [Sporomusa acidovorans]